VSSSNFPLTLFLIILFNLIVPTYSVWQVVLFQETGVVHRITYNFCYFLLLVALFTQFILDKLNTGLLNQVKLNHILLTYHRCLHSHTHMSLVRD